LFLQGIPGYLSLFSVQTLRVRVLKLTSSTHMVESSIVVINTVDSTQVLTHPLHPLIFLLYLQPDLPRPPYKSTYTLRQKLSISTRVHSLTAPAGTNFRDSLIYASNRGTLIPLLSFPDCCFIRLNLYQLRPLATSVLGDGSDSFGSPKATSDANFFQTILLIT